METYIYKFRFELKDGEEDSCTTHVLAKSMDEAKRKLKTITNYSSEYLVGVDLYLDPVSTDQEVLKEILTQEDDEDGVYERVEDEDGNYKPVLSTDLPGSGGGDYI